MSEDITKSVSQIEIAEALDICSNVPKIHSIIRRMAYELDILKQIEKELQLIILNKIVEEDQRMGLYENQ